MKIYKKTLRVSIYICTLWNQVCKDCAVNKKLLFQVQTRVYFFPINQQLNLLHINKEPKLRTSYLISQNDQ